MKTRAMKIADLHEDPANVRKHSPRNLEAIKASLTRFGQQKPIVVTKDGLVVAGNGTLQAARALGWEEIAVVETTLGGIDRTAFAIADNRTAELAEWDDDALAQTLRALQEEGFPLEDLAFDPAELAALSPQEPTEGNTDPDAVPEVETFVDPGQTWILGEHRLRCGDSTENWEGRPAADLVFTDPPYCVEYERTSEERGGSKNNSIHYVDPKDATSLLRGFLGQTKGDRAMVMTFPIDRHFQALAAAFLETGWELRKELIWAKNRFSFWPGAHYQQKHEPVLVCGRKGKPVPWFGEASATTLIECASTTQHTRHPTEKPVELWRSLLCNHTKTSDVVYEPFSGSGTTIIACEQSGRVCWAQELSPEFCSIGIRRWEEFTGRKAELLTSRTTSVGK